LRWRHTTQPVAAKPSENMGSSPAKNGGETKQNGGLTNTKTVV
jgi:hypothetical protein